MNLRWFVDLTSAVPKFEPNDKDELLFQFITWVPDSSMMTFDMNCGRPSKELNSRLNFLWISPRFRDIIRCFVHVHRNLSVGQFAGL